VEIGIMENNMDKALIGIMTDSKKMAFGKMASELNGLTKKIRNEQMSSNFSNFI
jgi:hypothetical protein